MKTATWSRLLPHGVVVVDGPVRTGPGDGNDVGALAPEEHAEIAQAVAKRQYEYATGRACAHRALARLGVPRAPLLGDLQRVPRWPAGVIGSITHASAEGAAEGLAEGKAQQKGWCAAAVAKSGELRSLGIDLEPCRALDPSLHRLVLTPRERRWIDAQPEARRGASARLVFSAKEAFYKCQYPCTRQLLDFQDVELELEDPVHAVRVEPGAFQVILLRAAGELAAGRTSLSGRYAENDGWWITAVTWAR